MLGDRNKKLIEAAQAGDVKNVKIYLKEGANIETKNNVM